MLKIYSWNVNGLRAVLKKNALQDFLKQENPDIVCLQEIKCKSNQNDFDFSELGYEILWNSAERPGYSGTAILSKLSLKEKPKKIELEKIFEEPKNPKTPELEAFNSFKELAINEGRVLVAEFEKFYLLNVYTPNSKPDLSRLKLREEIWDPSYLKLMNELGKKKTVITCGDFNCAHEEIDIARPKTNHHSAGFTDEERKGVSNILEVNFIDTFRSMHPEEVRYSWWSHWGHAREKNVGWRIDYFFVSSKLKKSLKSAEIHEKILGSDHCPVSIGVDL